MSHKERVRNGTSVFQSCRRLSGGSPYKVMVDRSATQAEGAEPYFERIRRIVRMEGLQYLAMVECRQSMLTKRKMHFQQTEIQPHFQSQQGMECHSMHPRTLNKTFQVGGKQAAAMRILGIFGGVKFAMSYTYSSSTCSSVEK